MKKTAASRKSAGKRAGPAGRSRGKDGGDVATDRKSLDSLDRFGMRYDAVLSRLSKR